LVNGTVDSVTMGVRHHWVDVEHRRARQRAVQQRSADFQLITFRSIEMSSFSIALSGLTGREFGAGHHLQQHRQREYHGFKNSQAEFADVYAPERSI
jgi:hypothetical protein